MITQSVIIHKRKAAYPVAIPFITETLDIILFAGKIPHKVPPVHMTHLVTKKPNHIITIRWRCIFSTLLVLFKTKPFGIKIGMILIVTCIPHPWKPLDIGTFILRFLFPPGWNIFIFSLYILHLTFFQFHISIRSILIIGGKMRSSYQWSFTILFAAQVINKVDGIINIVHINRWIGVGTDKRGKIHEIANHHKGITPKR